MAHVSFWQIAVYAFLVQKNLKNIMHGRVKMYVMR